jgi:hypothetical protein
MNWYLNCYAKEGDEELVVESYGPLGWSEASFLKKFVEPTHFRVAISKNPLADALTPANTIMDKVVVLARE